MTPVLERLRVRPPARLRRTLLHQTNSRLLSSHGQSRTQRIRALKRAAGQTPLHALLDAVLRHESIRVALSLTAILTTVLVGASVVVGMAWPTLPEDQRHAASPAAILSTVSQVLGGIFAVLLAIITFAVERQAHQGQQAGVLASLGARRHGLLLIAAWGLGVTCANVLPLALIALGWSVNLKVVLFADVLLVPVTLMLSFYLLSEMVRDASRPPAERGLSVLRLEVAEALAEDDFVGEMAHNFARELRTRGFEYSPLAWHITKPSKVQRLAFHVNRTGVIWDVDLLQLDALAQALKPFKDICTIQFSYQPGDDLTEQPCLVLSGDKGDIAISADVRQRVQQSLERLFVTSPRVQSASKDLHRWLATVDAKLKSLARVGPVGELETALDEFASIALEWISLSRLVAYRGEPTLFRQNAPRFAGPSAVDLAEVFQRAVQSSDEAHVLACLRLLYRLWMRALESSYLAYFAEMRKQLGFAYYAGRGSATAPVVSRWFDDSLHSALFRFTSRHPWDESPEFASERPFLIHGLGLALDLFHAAIQLRVVEDAEYFVDRIFEFERDEPGAVRWNARLPVAEAPWMPHEYVRILVVGYSIKHIESTDEGHRAAALAALRAATRRLPAREELIWVWEFYHTDNRGETLQSQLGAEFWDIEDNASGRAGRGRAILVDRSWPETGLLALLLVARPAASQRPAQFPAPPPSSLWPGKSYAERLGELAAVGALGIPEGERRQRCEAVESLVAARYFVASASQVQRWATQDLDAARCARLETSVREGLQEHGDFVSALIALAGQSRQVRLCSSARPAVQQRIPRDVLLVDGPGGVEELGNHAASIVARRERYGFAWMLEREVERLPLLRSLDALQDQILVGAETLRKRGYMPDTLFIPRDERFIVALFGTRRWDLPDIPRLANLHIGEWGGLHVFQWPYTNSSTVVLADVKRLVGVHAELDPSIRLEDAPDLDRRRVAMQAASAQDSASLPTIEDIAAILEVRQSPRLGLDDLAAARAIPLDLESVGFAMIPKDAVFHRPSCELLSGHSEVEYSLARGAEGDSESRRACSACRPLEWGLGELAIDGPLADDEDDI